MRTSKKASTSRPRRSEIALGVGAAVRARRTAAGLSQAALAGEGLTRFAVSKIESGASLPSLPTLAYLAKRLGVAPRDLIPPEL